ncbi:hypothetical protein [Spirosoma sp.]|uniref:hypothetical protein n=1 Tax=Spirosoma sp. TaxID=1899569 RepID=UPI002635DED8|nr:hypothetical protein [Spirosoma sp.]MCX6216543.1 hypothetical protein [Spirosoma sp.]
MKTWIDALTDAEQRLEEIQTSAIVGICFIDGSKRLVQLFDDDPDLREVIVEYYRKRLDQLARSSSTGNQVLRPSKA